MEGNMVCTYIYYNGVGDKLIDSSALSVFRVGCLVSLIYATDRQRNRCQTASSLNASAY